MVSRTELLRRYNDTTAWDEGTLLDLVLQFVSENAYESLLLDFLDAQERLELGEEDVDDDDWEDKAEDDEWDDDDWDDYYDWYNYRDWDDDDWDDEEEDV